MKPDVPAVLDDHAKRLIERIVPQLTGFDANSATMMAFMLQMVAEEWNRAAAMRVEENRAIRSLFREAAPLCANTPLAHRLTELAAGLDDDLHLTALEASNEFLRAALADLHAHVERCDTPEARRMDDAIWVELRRSVERRRVALANF